MIQIEEDMKIFLSERFRASDRENFFKPSKKANALAQEIFSTTAKKRNKNKNNVALMIAIKMFIFL